MRKLLGNLLEVFQLVKKSSEGVQVSFSADPTDPGFAFLSNSLLNYLTLNYVLPNGTPKSFLCLNLVLNADEMVDG